MNAPRPNAPAQRLDHVLAHAAAHFADRPALVERARQLTYRELDEHVSALAAELTAAGVGPGVRVGVHAPRGVAAVAAIYAVLRAGAVVAPLDPTDPPARTAGAVRGSGLHFLVTTAPGRAEQVTELLGCSGKQHDIGDLTVVRVSDAASTEPACDGGYIFTTSGSTGTPKGVLLSHESVLHFARWAVRALGLTPEDRVGAQAALTFDLSTFDLFSSALAGACVHLLPEGLAAFPAEVAGWLREQQITLLYAVPTLYRLLCRTGLLTGETAPKLRVLAFAGEPLPAELLAWYLAAFPAASCHNLYGPTETNVCTAEHFAAGSTGTGDAEVPIGQAIDGVHTVLLDRDGEPADRGELYVAGPTLLRGYLEHGVLRDPARDVAFPDGVTRRAYPTGDEARTADGGRLFLLGRSDDQVKRRGHRIDLRDVENALRESAAPEACAVVAKQGAYAGEIWAYVVGGESERRIMSRLAGVLPRRMLPDRIVRTDRLPVSGHGKVDRRELAELASTEGA